MVMAKSIYSTLSSRRWDRILPARTFRCANVVTFKTSKKMFVSATFSQKLPVNGVRATGDNNCHQDKSTNNKRLKHLLDKFIRNLYYYINYILSGSVDHEPVKHITSELIGDIHCVDYILYRNINLKLLKNFNYDSLKHLINKLFRAVYYFLYIIYGNVHYEFVNSDHNYNHNHRDKQHRKLNH
ncbi:hypothetical protein M7I_8011 [Glarea lozoyensis 74030]|uniref:Uncharacterized protein n=1 Tax=Glarea lozoyensis (strain ATCC 74030 / MF5533) TaxID=1104152 RepID=H0EYV1_GLAL7|nr:hypothetical protein M7I_8011 [Glarea lozoyensis 74030]